METDELDMDAIEVLGIDPKVWKEFRGMKDEKYVQDDLPYFQQQDDKEAFERHKQAMAKRWFGYYKKCKSKRNTIIDQYNKIAMMKSHQKN